MGGIYIETFQFDDLAPTLDEITKAVEKQSGFRVKIVSDIHKDSLNDWLTDIAFSCKDDWSIQISKDKKELIKLQTYLGCEPTLLTMTSLALESLGGNDIFNSESKNQADFMEKYGVAISEEEYLVRCENHYREMKKMTFFGVLFNGFFLILFLLCLGYGAFWIVTKLIGLFN